MKYFLIILFFFIGCENKKEHKKVYIEDILPQKKVNTNLKSIETKIKIKDLVFKEVDNNINYNFKKQIILVFLNGNKLSNLQKLELNSSNYNFYIVNNKKLNKFFKINNYPTIIITKDNNNIKRYNGYIPNEILKYELKDK